MEVGSTVVTYSERSKLCGAHSFHLHGGENCAPRTVFTSGALFERGLRGDLRGKEGEREKMSSTMKLTMKKYSNEGIITNM